MRIIGLTGGIATGKSTVADYLSTHHGLPVLDADVFAREAVAVGSPILTAIAVRYGSEILQADGSLNRQHLGDIIFPDPAERHWLEQQIHPYVRSQFEQAAARLPPDQTVVYAIPLLFEANLTRLVSEIWVVTCSDTQQQARLMARNALSAEQAQARIQSQMSLAEKARLADVVLTNTSTREALWAQVDQALQQHR